MPFHCFPGGVHVAGHDVFRNLSRQTGGAADQPLMVFLNDLVAYPRLSVVQALNVSQRDYVGEVLVALVVLGEKD